MPLVPLVPLLPLVPELPGQFAVVAGPEPPLWETEDGPPDPRDDPCVTTGPGPGPEEGETGGHGAPGFDAGTSACDVVPDAVVACADVAVALPGHQATNHPSATVATTS